MLPLKKTAPPIQDPDLVISHKRPVKWQDPAFVDDLIELKKARHRDYRRRKLLYSSIGFMMSLLLIVGIFEWKTYDKAEEIDLADKASVIDDLLDIPVTQQPPPPPKRVIKQPNIVAVPEEEMIEEMEIDLDMDINEDTQIEEIIVEDIMEDVEEETAEEKKA